MRSTRFTVGLLLGLTALLASGCPVEPDDPNDCGSDAFCSYHGTCDDSSGTEVCECDPGYAGTRCGQCAAGYVPDGSGCVAADPCEVMCDGLHRINLGNVGGDCRCGGCLEGFYEHNNNCYQICEAETFGGELVPLDLYVMLDRSASMRDGSKWGSVTSALTTFVASPETAGIGIGLQYFPVDPTGPIPGACTNDGQCGLYGPCLPMLNQCGGSFATDTSCDPLDYDEAELEISELPGAAAAFTASINAASPDGSATPTEQAMYGATTYAVAWAQSHPDHLVYIVFATDGEPTGCTTNSVSGAASLAAAAATGDPAVPTYVFGVEFDAEGALDSLDEIAQAGGTGAAILVDSGANVTQQFIDLLNDIRANGLCKYRIPQPTQGVINYDKINVQTKDPAVPGSNETVLYVGDAASCDPATGGWYYDDPATPTMIQLCPATCQRVQLEDLAVDVLVGCDTIVG
jgi:hypothetical protein